MEEIGLDLSPLRSDIDYHLPAGRSLSAGGTQPWDIIINPCGPVVSREYYCPPPDRTSPADPPICLYSGPGAAWAAGSAKTATYWKNLDGSVTVQYAGGSNSEIGTWSTEIQFFCDLDAGKGFPQFISQVSRGHLKLSWNTSVVCSPPPLLDPCGTSRVSLSLMRGEISDYSIKTPIWSALLNICGGLKRKCADKAAAACQIFPTANNYSLGSFKTVTYTDTRYGVIARYTGGNNLRSFKIEFICDPSTRSAGSPEFSNEAPTRNFNFMWRSILACAPCGLPGVNLRPLRDMMYDYHIPATPNGQPPYDIYLNMCGGLLSTNTLWRYDSSPDDPNMSLDNGLAAGSEKTVIYTFNPAGLLATWTMGASSGRGPLSSQIQFICDPNAGIGFPKFISENPPGQINLEWVTSFACKSIPPLKSKPNQRGWNS